MCELCNIIPDKYAKGKIMVNNYFVLHEEFIYVFHENNYSHNRTLSFYLARVRIIGSMECENNINDCFRANA